MSGRPIRPLPKLTERNRHFWQGGKDGSLMILRCQDCGYFIHPPGPICPQDWSKNLVPEATSGRAVVASYTINYHQWLPGFDPPYIIGLVEIREQPDLRLTTNIVGCSIESVHIGMDVQVVFEHHRDPDGDVWLPLFEPFQGQ
jgi:uncharacterized OB-fold protein